MYTIGMELFTDGVEGAGEVGAWDQGCKGGRRWVAKDEVGVWVVEEGECGGAEGWLALADCTVVEVAVGWIGERGGERGRVMDCRVLGLVWFGLGM